MLLYRQTSGGCKITFSEFLNDAAREDVELNIKEHLPDPDNGCFIQIEAGEIEIES